MAARSRARDLDRARRCLGQDRTAARRPRCRDGQARAMRGGHLEAIEALPSTSRRDVRTGHKWPKFQSEP